MSDLKIIHTHIDSPDFERIKKYSQSLEITIGGCARLILTEIIKEYNEIGFVIEEERMLRKPKIKHSYHDIQVSIEQEYYNKLGNIANDMKTGVGSCARRLFRIYFIARSIRQIRKKLSTINPQNAAKGPFNSSRIKNRIKLVLFFSALGGINFLSEQAHPCGSLAFGRRIIKYI